MSKQSPPSWASEPCLLGVDEAGRGPVLGPMVYGVAYCPISQKEALSKRAFADSKTLTEEKREFLFEEIAADPNFGADFVLYMRDIGYARDTAICHDSFVCSQKVSLNVIANESTFKLIDEVLALGVNLKEIYVDTVGDAARWHDRLLSRYPAIRFTVCPKADSIYPIVSAASIVAKVTRDRELKNFQLEEGVASDEPFGSGYPGDPQTVKWLAANMDPVFGFPSVVRFSWQTAQKLLEERAAKVSWECDDDSDASQGTLGFAATYRAPSKSTGLGRHSYFQARKLQRLTQF